MKIGLSSYSLYRAIKAGELDYVSALDWIAANGGEHMEVVPLEIDFTREPQLVQNIKEKAKSVGIELSNYAVGANFLTQNEGAYEEEISRVKREVDVAAELGVKLMRHDVARHEDVSIRTFNANLDRMIEACRTIADYAAQYGITTSIENHGYLVQASDRVLTVVQGVNRPNFKTTLDIGNFMCADENPVASVQKNLPFASIVHIKDFYLRPSYRNPGEGWFKTTAGNYLRGAIAGQGDIDMWEVLRLVKRSGFDGYLSIEFEGMEECKQGSKIAMDNVKRIWAEV
ncbi:sugar phosphate isomerase/epimerase family protein [Paenibacillus chitinolyticus]|uniref:Sugar phosphate isomerase/epimerase n=1 Tax=Paenibacillus chitinolyticus TaxID=79263 RepID=A0A410WSP6_9BACL|nr:sugar phosphate isomerase/epimerase family protein [Paenibacillus chitinolyticus]MCY9591204.1 sugar phosphate isomerase/epimerase [Paenibacillus chitinolyticus]MCY9595613.1 sugar phosphate isomerase/epimerase [Paenibacillus chitinolyticus]QAV17374.1 sugar phosphate isomerase/epimerase [Paenibacillus chitinolyticus]